MIQSILLHQKDRTDYLAVDLNTNNSSSDDVTVLQLANLHVAHMLGKHEETCNKNMGLLLHSSFRKHRISGDYWLPTRYIPGRSLSQELSDQNSSFDSNELYNKAVAELDRLHRSGYYHGSATTLNFRVDWKSGSVHLVNFHQCSKLDKPYATNILGGFDDFIQNDYKMLLKNEFPSSIRNSFKT